MTPETKDFKKNLPIHLANKTMRKNISAAAFSSIGVTHKTAADISEWQEMRQQAHLLKKQIIDNLPENINTFEKNARKRGIKVLRAKDAAEAVALAEEIARKHRVKQIVKSKSMLTEEIGFNRFMIEKGYDVVETDLGEYIIQLADETPSHLIGPAMHKSRVEIAQLFHEKLGLPYSEDPKVLTQAARELLRQKFLTAEMGVTGANFGIVENGCITIVENEGNARMCSTVPDVHVAFIGMERLIARASDLSIFLRLLCISGTGQKLASFISTIDGPRQPGAFDGPEHVYYIIVDNKRSSFLEDDQLKQALYCIRCGACYNTCPVYGNIGGHAYGWVYQGPIGAVITPQFVGLENAKDLPFASSLCGSCTEVCPVKIPLHHLLLYQRKRIVETVGAALPEKIAMRGFGKVMASFKRYSRFGAVAKKLLRLTGGKFPKITWRVSRELPKIPAGSFRDWWEEGRGGSGK